MLQSSKIHLDLSGSLTAEIAKPDFITVSFLSPCSKSLAKSALIPLNTPNTKLRRGHYSDQLILSSILKHSLNFFVLNKKNSWHYKIKSNNI